MSLRRGCGYLDEIGVPMFDAPPVVRANSGGPMSRRRTEHVVASLLREGTGGIWLPGVRRAGLAFGTREPVSRVLESLAHVGLSDPERLRDRYEVPPAPLLCRVVPNAPWAADVGTLDDDALLAQALLLGLCTAHQFDPARPVLWTSASLTRCVELHEPQGFYA